MEEKACLELIATDIRKNDGAISYPSTLGQNCNTEAKLQLVLFLVRITCAKIIHINLEHNGRNRKIIFFDHIVSYFFLGDYVYERSIVITLCPINCRSFSSGLESSIRDYCEISSVISYFISCNSFQRDSYLYNTITRTDESNN